LERRITASMRSYHLSGLCSLLCHIWLNHARPWVLQRGHRSAGCGPTAVRRRLGLRSGGPQASVTVQYTLANNRCVIGAELALLASADAGTIFVRASPRILPRRLAVEVNRWAVVVANRPCTPVRESQLPLKKAMIFTLAQLMRAHGDEELAGWTGNAFSAGSET
jgi:hypothetical protein